MNQKKINLMKKIAKEYYLDKKSQVEIAEKNALSKSKVSRLLNEIIESGYISFKLNFPASRNEEISSGLEDKLGVGYVYVSDGSTLENVNLVEDVAQGLTSYLNEVTNDGEIIGVSWGKTMYQLSKHIDKLETKQTKVVQLHGGVSNTNTDTLSTDIVRNFGNKWDAEWLTLPVPSIVDNSFIAKTFREDSSIKHIFEKIDIASTVIFSVGTIDSDALGIKAGYFSKEDFLLLESKGYIGDICSRYYKTDGSHARGELYDRVLGISLEQLKMKKHKICIALDKKKAESIVSAVKGEYINALFIDEGTASAILKLL